MCVIVSVSASVSVSVSVRVRMRMIKRVRVRVWIMNVGKSVSISVTMGAEDLINSRISALSSHGQLAEEQLRYPCDRNITVRCDTMTQ